MGARRPVDEDDATATRSRAEPRPETAPTFAIAVVEGSDAGRRLLIAGTQPSRLLVGTSPACALRLSDRRVSRRHAAFEATEESPRLTDLESTNGTTVNGVRVVEAHLRGGERVHLGETRLDIEIVES